MTSIFEFNKTNLLRPSTSGKPTSYLGGRTSSIISNTSAGSLNDDFSDDDYEEDDDFDGKFLYIFN